VAKFIYYQWLAEFLEANDFEFIWDEGNSQKNSEKHGVSRTESQEAASFTTFYRGEVWHNG
jgi:hypothetical protein